MLLFLQTLGEKYSLLQHKRAVQQVQCLQGRGRLRAFRRDLSAVGAVERTEGIVELHPRFDLVNHAAKRLRPELTFPLESVSTQLQLYEWEYMHDTKTDRGWRTIRVTSPLTWVVAYSSTYSLSMLRQVLAGQEERDPEAVRAFVLRACLMHLHFTKFPAIAELLAGLRYRVEVRHSPELGDLPLVTLSPSFSTVRPPDNLVTMASGLAGGASFAEVLDLESPMTLANSGRR